MPQLVGRPDPLSSGLHGFRAQSSPHAHDASRSRPPCSSMCNNPPRAPLTNVGHWRAHRSPPFRRTGSYRYMAAKVPGQRASAMAAARPPPECPNARQPALPEHALLLPGVSWAHGLPLSMAGQSSNGLWLHSSHSRHALRCVCALSCWQPLLLQPQPRTRGPVLLHVGMHIAHWHSSRDELECISTFTYLACS